MAYPMAESIKTAIFMDDEAAAQYVTCLKYWNVIEELNRIDFYNMKNGKVELHKDGLGNFSLLTQHIQVRNYIGGDKRLDKRHPSGTMIT